MLSFNKLGRMGRLGNQMFQYACLLSVAQEHGYDFCIPPSAGQDEFKEHQLFRAFNLPSLRVIGWQRTNLIASQPGFAFDNKFIREIRDGSDLVGFFQSEKFFIQRDIIHKEFIFKSEISEHAKSIISKIGASVISVHVRRGDYLLLKDRFPVLPLDYYSAALRYLPMDLPILVFSDDIEWCKSAELFRGDRWFFSETQSNILDMCLMSMCDHHIIANSSFSWWGAWLSTSPKKIVIGPRRWFGEHAVKAKIDTKDVLPESWISI